MHDPTYQAVEIENNRKCNLMAQKILAAFPYPDDFRQFVRRVWKHPEGQDDMIRRIERQAQRPRR